MTFEKWPEENESYIMKFLGKGEHFPGKRKRAKTWTMECTQQTQRSARSLGRLNWERRRDRIRSKRNNKAQTKHHLRSHWKTLLYHIRSPLFVSEKLKPKQISFHITRVEKLVHNYKHWWVFKWTPITAGRILNSRAVLERNSFTPDTAIAFLTL